VLVSLAVAEKNVKLQVMDWNVLPPVEFLDFKINGESL